MIFQDAKNNILILLNQNSVFSVYHDDTFDHTYCIDPGNLLNI